MSSKESQKGAVEHSEHHLDPATKRQVMGLFLTVLIDLLGFAMFLPDLQLRLTTFVNPGFLTGITIASYSIAQLITSPILGRWSDTVGRRRVLLLSTLLEVGAYLLYSHPTNLGILVLSRVLLGIGAANLGVAFAYVADITKPAQRAPALGMLGAAFGLGFIFGPPIGVVLLKLGHGQPALLGYVGATLALANFCYVYFLLPESLKHDGDFGKKPGLISNFKLAITDPLLALMLFMFFALNLGFTHMETTFFLLLSDPRSVFHLGADQAKTTGAIILGTVGMVQAFTQGVLVQRLVPRFGELRLLRVGYAVLVPSLCLLPWMPLWVPAFLVVIVLGMSAGISSPSLSGMISKAAPARIQGGIFGITQGLGALARCIGPVSSHALFAQHPAAPYAVGAAIAAIPATLSWRLKLPKRELQAEPATTS